MFGDWIWIGPPENWLTMAWCCWLFGDVIFDGFRVATPWEFCAG